MGVQHNKTATTVCAYHGKIHGIDDGPPLEDVRVSHERHAEVAHHGHHADSKQKLLVVPHLIAVDGNLLIPGALAGEGPQVPQGQERGTHGILAGQRQQR